MKLLFLLACLLIICVLYTKYSDNNKELFEGSMFYRNRQDNPIYRENLPVKNKPYELSILMDTDHRLYYNTCITNGEYKLCYDENGMILFAPFGSKVILDNIFVSGLGNRKENSMIYIEPNGNIVLKVEGGELIKNSFDYIGRDNYPYVIAYDVDKNILGIYDKNWVLVKKL